MLTSAEAAEGTHGRSASASPLRPGGLSPAFPRLARGINPCAVAGIWVTGHRALGMQSQEHALLPSRLMDVAVSVCPSAQQQRILQQLSHGHQQTLPGLSSPDVSGGRWGKSSERSRARLPAALPSLPAGLQAGGASCGITTFDPPGPQLILDGDMCQVRLCCCPAGRSPVPFPAGMFCNGLLHPKLLESPGRASVSPPHPPANDSDPLPPFPTGGFC